MLSDVKPVKNLT